MSISCANPTRTAIVGCGEHSHVHGEAASKLKEIRITACCDIVEDRACSWAEKYGCERYYTDISEMLAKEELDAVILCTWPGQHLEQIKSCLDAGIKNILCEKSLTVSGEEALTILKLADEQKAFIMEACKNRHHPAMRKMEQLVFNGENGPIDSIRAVFNNYEPENETLPHDQRNWRERKECGGGVAYDWVSYLVNACNHFSGGRPVRVFASGDTGRVSGVINRIHGMIEYDNGIVGYVESSKRASFSQELQITCTKGILRLPVAWGIFGEVKITRTHRKEPWDYILTDTYEVEHIDAFYLQLKNFAEAINGKAEPVMPLEQSVMNIRTIDALVESIEKGKVIDLL
jgi:predicted dehydrogenase